MELENLLVKLLRPGAQMPARATQGSVGFDLSACLEEPLPVPVGSIVKVPTGVALSLAPGTGGFVFGRSGLGVNHGLAPVNGVGVIDWDYRGEIFVGLINHGPKHYVIMPGQRIAQLVILPVLIPQILPADALDETGRGERGFGSTGAGRLDGESPL